jgi:hypothetical protein
MAASSKPEWMRGLDPDQVEFYQRLSPAAAACRGGRRHQFQLRDLLTRDRLPRGIDLAPQAGGVYQVTDHCARKCGRWIRYTTNAAGAIDWDSAHYGGAEDTYLATGLGLSAADDRLFMQWLIDQRFADQLRAFIKRQPVQAVAS